MIILKINIADIISVQGATKKISVILEDAVLPCDFYSMTLTEPVKLTGELESDDGNIHLTGYLTTQVKAECDRCMCDLIYNIKSEVTESFGSVIPGMIGQIEPINQSTIDLDSVLEETLLLSLPMKALCDPNCKGICTVCGQNLNKQSCDCDVEYLDPRLEKLDLLFGSKGQDEKNEEV